MVEPAKVFDLDELQERLGDDRNLSGASSRATSCSGTTRSEEPAQAESKAGSGSAGLYTQTPGWSQDWKREQWGQKPSDGDGPEAWNFPRGGGWSGKDYHSGDHSDNDSVASSRRGAGSSRGGTKERHGSHPRAPRSGTPMTRGPSGRQQKEERKWHSARHATGVDAIPENQGQAGPAGKGDGRLEAAHWGCFVLFRSLAGATRPR